MNITELQNKLQLLNINLTGRALAEIWGMNETSISDKKRLGTPIKVKHLKILEEKFHITLLNDEKEIPQLDSIAERVKYIRKFLGLSQGELGEKLSITKQAIANVEGNKNNPSIEFITNLNLVFNVNLNWLMTGVGKPFIPVLNK